MIRGFFHVLGQPMLAFGILLTFCIGVLAFLLFGRTPVNQLHLWQLERDFYHNNSIHPRESFLLQKRTYVGGPYDHGSQRCGVFVGELRAAPLNKEQVRRAYEGRSIKSGEIPLQMLFLDAQWPMYLPLTVWQDEWRENALLKTSSTLFFVFASQEEYPSWGDIRCDD